MDEIRGGAGAGARCWRASLLSGTSPGRGHPQPEAPPSRRALTGLRASALGPGGPELRRGLGGQSGADPGSRLPAPCDGARGAAGGRALPGGGERVLRGGGQRSGSGEPLRRGESRGSRDPLRLPSAPRGLEALRGSLGRPCRGPAPLPCRAEVRMLDPRAQRQKMGPGLSLPRGTWGCSAPGTWRSPRASSGCGPHPHPELIQPRG